VGDLGSHLSIFQPNACANGNWLRMRSAPPFSRRAIECATNTSRSQYSEDLVLLPTLLAAAGGQAEIFDTMRKSAGGRFVELGAYDGITLSNTYALERCFGWSGLLVEANPMNARIAARRGRRKNTTSVLHSAASCDGSTQTTVNMTVRGGTIAAQVGIGNGAHFRKWTRVLGTVPAMVQVPCAPLPTLMRQAGLARSAEEDPSATFLSLDVEGAEQLVLQYARPERFAVIMVEHRTELEGKGSRGRIDELMRRAGMRRAIALPVDRSVVYLRSDVAELHSPELEEQMKARGGVGAVAAARMRQVRERRAG
jgi:hypothetical protein